MSVQQSGEDYLEAVLMLHEELGHARSVDVANKLHVSKPSVSVALRRLRDEGCVTVADDGNILLTHEGRRIAVRIYDRHKVLIALLTKLGVSDKVAAEDACRVEHVISDQSFAAICKFLGNKIS